MNEWAEYHHEWLEDVLQDAAYALLACHTRNLPSLEGRTVDEWSERHASVLAELRTRPESKFYESH